MPFMNGIPNVTKLEKCLSTFLIWHDYNELEGVFYSSMNHKLQYRKRGHVIH